MPLSMASLGCRLIQQQKANEAALQQQAEEEEEEEVGCCTQLLKWCARCLMLVLSHAPIGRPANQLHSDFSSVQGLHLVGFSSMRAAYLMLWPSIFISPPASANPLQIFNGGDCTGHPDAWNVSFMHI